MLDWFRSWHGAPTDAKWLVIGKRAGVAPGIVSAIMWAILDHASQNENRGDVTGFDFETYAAFSGFEEEQVRAVYGALEAKGIIIQGRIAQWEKRQPKREDGSSADRVKAHRKRVEPQPTLAIEPERPHEPVVEEVPPAPELAESAIEPEAIILADQIAVIAGHDIEFVPPTWCGATTRVQFWLRSGWTPQMILQSVKGQMQRKRDGPPDRIQYFEKGIAADIARCQAPLPIVKLLEQEVVHAKIGNGGGFANLSVNLARQAREETDSERSPGTLRVVDG